MEGACSYVAQANTCVRAWAHVEVHRHRCATGSTFHRKSESTFHQLLSWSKKQTTGQHFTNFCLGVKNKQRVNISPTFVLEKKTKNFTKFCLREKWEILCATRAAAAQIKQLFCFVCGVAEVAVERTKRCKRRAKQTSGLIQCVLIVLDCLVVVLHITTIYLCLVGIGRDSDGRVIKS